MARFCERKLWEVDLPSSYCEDLSKCKVAIVLISEEFILSSNKDDKFQNIISTKIDEAFPIVPVVIDEYAKANWGQVGGFAELFRIDIVPNNETGQPSPDQVEEFKGRIRRLSGVLTSSYYITMHGEPRWESYVQRDSPYLERGFSDERVGCGAGGVFVAYDEHVQGTIQLTIGKATFWAHSSRDHPQMLEWRVFRAQHNGWKYLVTSNRADTAPGWSLYELFYAKGKPSKGFDQQESSETQPFHVFNSHNWGIGMLNHRLVMDFHEYLMERGVISWVDEAQLNQNEAIMPQLERAIDRSIVVVVYITEAYIAKISGNNEFDYCRREFLYYFSRHASDLVKLVFAEVEMLDDWGPLSSLRSTCPRVVPLNPESLYITLSNCIGISASLYYITMKEWESYVNKDFPFTEQGFKETGSCGAGGCFEAYDQPLHGFIEISVKNATCYVCKEKVSTQQLEWRYYRYSDSNCTKYLVTSNRRDMAPGWTYQQSFYARGRPSNGCNQIATL